MPDAIEHPQGYDEARLPAMRDRLHDHSQTWPAFSHPRMVAPVFVTVLALWLLAQPAASEPTGQEAGLRKGETVSFEAEDGTLLVGRLFGDGRVGIILAHMGRPGDTQADWIPLARALAERGHMALTYNRRGVCSAPGQECSAGPDDYANSWKDVVGAWNFIRSRGATTVVLIGASIGAMSMLHAAVTNQVKPAALIEIGGVNHRSGYHFSREQLERLEGAKLFVSSSGDRYGGAQAAREWYGWSKEPKRLEIVTGHEHGTDMFEESQPTAKPLIELVLRFVAHIVSPGAGNRDIHGGGRSVSGRDDIDASALKQGQRFPYKQLVKGVARAGLQVVRANLEYGAWCH